MNDDVIYWGITLICLLISVPAAFSMNNSLHKKHPDVKPYAWEYYVGLMGALGGAAAGILYFIAALKTYGSRSDTFVLLGIFFLVIAVVHVFMFEPYGRYVSDSEWWQIVNIIVSPPVVLVFGYLLYIKVIKQENRNTEDKQA